MEPVEVRSESSEYAGALKPLRVLKTLVWLLVLAALAVQVTAFVLVQFTHALPRWRWIPLESAAQTQPATAPQSQPSPSERSGPSEAAVNPTLVQTTISAMTAARFVGPAAASLLIVQVFLMLQISLVGKLGGARGFSAALAWSLVLLVALVPWEQVLPSGRVPNVLCDYFDMQNAVNRVEPDWVAGRYYTPEVMLHYVRFLLVPFIILLIWLTIGFRFAAGMKQVNRATTVPSQEPAPSALRDQ